MQGPQSRSASGPRGRSLVVVVNDGGGGGGRRTPAVAANLGSQSCAVSAAQPDQIATPASCHSSARGVFVTTEWVTRLVCCSLPPRCTAAAHSRKADLRKTGAEQAGLTEEQQVGGGRQQDWGWRWDGGLMGYGWMCELRQAAADHEPWDMGHVLPNLPRLARRSARFSFLSAPHSTRSVPRTGWRE
jgi:hypothetical protein